MTTIEFRPISTPAERLEFVRGFLENSGIDMLFLMEAYVSKAHIVAGFDSAGAMVCGYLLAPGRSMRWPEIVPKHTAFQQTTPLDQVVEINGVWLKPQLRGRSTSLALWMNLRKKLLSENWNYITFAVDPAKLGLVRLYQAISSGLIYDGPFHNTKMKAGKVYWSARWRFRFLPVLYLWGICRRFLGFSPSEQRTIA